MMGRAFAPGHITGFFEIRDVPKDPLKKGSRGVGVNLSLGVLSTVEAEPAGRSNIEILLNGKAVEARTTKKAVALILGTRKMKIKVDSRVELPIGQGLGMSAAGALSTALALSKAIGRSHSFLKAGEAAHCAEVMERTGLGDVAGQTRGGWEMRVRSGFPPHGFVDRILAPASEMVICVSGEPVLTKAVLSDPVKRKAITNAGRKCMNEFLLDPNLENFFRLSREFAGRTALASDCSLALVDKIRSMGLGMAGVSMIGNSVFAIGDVHKLKMLMGRHGEVFCCSVDIQGARLVA